MILSFGKINAVINSKHFSRSFTINNMACDQIISKFTCLKYSLSNYITSTHVDKAINPETGKLQSAIFIDVYYGKHSYGVGFRKDGALKLVS